jgi:cAMP-dependent protein kinase regulator
MLFFFSGFYDIIVNNNTVGKYENKGSFGELALMYNQPRAATIIATSEGSLWAMVRDQRVHCGKW